MKTRSIGEVLLELFQQSVIVQSLITVILVGVAGGMMLAGKLEQVPGEWWGLVQLVVGYWVGSKGNLQMVQSNRAMLESLERQTELQLQMLRTLGS